MFCSVCDDDDDVVEVNMLETSKNFYFTLKGLEL